jgi:hypothetical protein
MVNKVSKRIFDEMKAAAISTWTSHDGAEVYIKEKIKIVNDEDKIENSMSLYRIFDFENKRIFLSKVSEETKLYIKNSK